jgi:hypothetical protein
MKAERLAEIRAEHLQEEAEDAVENWIRRPSHIHRGELIDALTAERARAERAVELAREMFNAAGQAPASR